jgi:hypothetical protein
MGSSNCRLSFAVSLLFTKAESEFVAHKSHVFSFIHIELRGHAEESVVSSHEGDLLEEKKE